MQWNNGLCLLSRHHPNNGYNIWEEIQDILDMEGKIKVKVLVYSLVSHTMYISHDFTIYQIPRIG